MEAIIKNGGVTRGWIGVEPQNITNELAQTLKIEKNGVLIVGTLQSGPADKAGIKPGDVLKSIDGQVIQDITQLLNKISQITPGNKVKAIVNRKGKDLDLEVQVGKRPGPKKK
jgi:serine protease DegQ